MACKVLSVVGNPTLLLEEVNTFKQVLADIDIVQSKLEHVSAAIESNATLSTKESLNLVRHLGTFGMVDTVSTFDMPPSISAIYRTINDDIAPAFKDGNVTTYIYAQPPANPVEAFFMAPGMGLLVTLFLATSALLTVLVVLWLRCMLMRAPTGSPSQLHPLTLDRTAFFMCLLASSV